MTAGWVDDEITIRVVLDRAGESAEAIAASTEAFVQAFAARAGVTPWEVVDGPPWSGSEAALSEIVRANPSKAATGDPDPRDGYSFSLYVRREPTALSVGVSVGGPVIGRRLPQQNVRGRLINPQGVPVDASLADTMFEALIEAWQPLFASLSASEISNAARRGNWKIPAGYRVWLRNGTVELDQLADGVTRRPFAGGTMIAVPDNWPPDLIANRLGETYERNGVDTVPH
jgi:hypothetical protein